jgi:hypothetical protein
LASILRPFHRWDLQRPLIIYYNLKKKSIPQNKSVLIASGTVKKRKRIIAKKKGKGRPKFTEKIPKKANISKNIGFRAQRA